MTGLMSRQWRGTALSLSVAVWFVSLFLGLAEQQRARRLAADPIVSATVRAAWLEHQRGGSVPYAHLVYDRKRPDGQTVHCDVSRVYVGGSGRTLLAGDMLMIAPRPEGCWEPDIICETCAPVTSRQTAMLLVVSALSGLLFVVLIWRAINELRRDGMANAKVA